MELEYIASGAQADIYRDGTKAIKLFKNCCRKEDVEYEINLQKMALDYGLPVPEIFDLTEIDGKYGIVMEYIDGIPLGKILLEGKAQSMECFEKSIEIQDSIHRIETNKFPLMKDRLKNHILYGNKLNDTAKEKVLNKLENMEFDNKLCHGDFHVFNLIKTSGGIKIIDWVCAVQGNAAADICRTYLLYKLVNDEIANLYLELYCKLIKRDKEDILEWLLIVAAARLGEYTKDENEVKILNGIIENSL